MLEDIKTKTYVSLISWAGSMVLLASLPFVPLRDLQEILLFAVLCAIAQTMPVPLFRSSAVSVAFAFTFAGMILYGPAAAIWINLGSSVAAAFRPKPKPLHKAVFNASNHALSAVLAFTVYLGSGGNVLPDQPLTAILPSLLAGSTYFAVQTLLLSEVIALTERTNFLKVWETNFRWSALNFISLAVLGLGLAQASRVMGNLGIAVFSIPLVLAWYSFQMYMAKSKEVRLQNETLKLTYEKLEESYVNTIQALATAVEVKDHYTHGHSEGAMRYAVVMARELGLAEEEIATIQLAALFHDVGKIGIADHILNKPSKLTDEEWKAVREHPVIGSKLIQQISSFARVVPGIMYHHERYDGTGYPMGLNGERIPLAAQIIAVADAFQAMTSTRPYRTAYSQEYAMQELRRCSSTQFNPRVVDAFVKAMEDGSDTNEVSLPNLQCLFQPQEVKVHVHAN